MVVPTDINILLTGRRQRDASPSQVAVDARVDSQIEVSNSLLLQYPAPTSRQIV